MPTPSLSTRACEAGMLCMPAVKHSVMGRIHARGNGALRRSRGAAECRARPAGRCAFICGEQPVNSRCCVCGRVGVEGTLDTVVMVSKEHYSIKYATPPYRGPIRNARRPTLESRGPKSR